MSLLLFVYLTKCHYSLGHQQIQSISESVPNATDNPCRHHKSPGQKRAAPRAGHCMQFSSPAERFFMLTIPCHVVRENFSSPCMLLQKSWQVQKKRRSFFARFLHHHADKEAGFFYLLPIHFCFKPGKRSERTALLIQYSALCGLLFSIPPRYKNFSWIFWEKRFLRGIFFHTCWPSLLLPSSKKWILDLKKRLIPSIQGKSTCLNLLLTHFECCLDLRKRRLVTPTLSKY